MPEPFFSAKFDVRLIPVSITANTMNASTIRIVGSKRKLASPRISRLEIVVYGLIALGAALPFCLPGRRGTAPTRTSGRDFNQTGERFEHRHWSPGSVQSRGTFRTMEKVLIIATTEICSEDGLPPWVSVEPESVVSAVSMEALESIPLLER